ncbi:SpoIIE family protein phosphatase [Streptosporangium subroseum]|uniref:SpoIIE family protein phosphatase n=1 Tax=Streptosporangium subroseum TaxID=106412 RepID=UPI00309189CD|nr:SpoIIE family protein phosphatase [Streptosporangium subroseum]
MEETADARVGARETTPSGPGMREMLSGGGRMGALVRGHDWPSSPLGPMDGWPQSLRSSLSICLSSRFPMFVFWGPDMVQLYNDSFMPVLGAKHPAALGQTARDTWSETWDVVGPMLQQVLDGGEAAYFEDLLVILQRSGLTEECYFTFSYSPVRDESGQVGGVFGTVSETTPQVVEERRLAILAELSGRTRTRGSVAEVCQAAGEVFSRHPVDVPFALLYLLDAQGEQAVLAASSGLVPDSALSPQMISLTAAEQGAAFSWPLADARAGPVEVSCPADVQLTAMTREGFDPPSTAMVMPIVRAGAERPTGLLVIGLNSGRPLDEGYRRFLTLTTGHLSAAVADATALEAARERAEQLAALDHAKTTFFSNVSHELRTPLTLILGPLEDLLADPDTLRPGDRDRIDMIHRNALRLLKQVNTLLDFSRAQSGDGGIRPEPLDLAALTAELASLFQAALEHGGLRLVLNCPPLPQPVWADRDAWEKITLNLLSNAFKFTLAGEITITVDAHGGQARLRVTDTGAGIASSELPYLFDRFHRVAGTVARSGEGSGIGLSLVRELVERHGGTIEVESALGAGSTFTVLLPFGEPSPAAIIPATASLAPARSQAYVLEALGWTSAVSGTDADGPPEILIVDDNADMRAHLTRALAPHWRVQAVQDGQAALEAIGVEAPELVLTDVMMPHLDGFGLLKELRSAEATRDIPVVMVSARAGTEAIVDGLAVGADDYLVKPFTTAELVARVRTHLHTARQRRHTATRIQALADITHQLNTSLDLEQIGRALAGHLVPAYARGCAIWLRTDTGQPPMRLLHTTVGADTPPHLRTALQHPPTSSADTNDQLVLPLLYRGRQIGAVQLAGLTPAGLHPAERPFLTELIHRAALALDNATRYEHQRGIALHLQAAMLTDLPITPGLNSAALYLPAADQDLVGGDWYDAFPLPSRAGVFGTSLAVTVGDITGHDLHAATLMGQVRSMLRQAVLDHPVLGPAAAVSALEHACRTLPLAATGSLIHGRLDQQTDAWTFTWTNAGHPPPLLLHPDGHVERLTPRNVLFYPAMFAITRTEHQRRLPPGSILLLYTDGLIDRPGNDLDADVDHAIRLLTTHHHRPLPDLLHALAAQIVGPRPTDDIALLAIRIH